jgi:hypothetical protein
MLVFDSNLEQDAIRRSDLLNSLANKGLKKVLASQCEESSLEQ